MKPAATEPDRPLTLDQLSAIDLLVSGKNDLETATALGTHRVTVSRWRLYHVEFRAELARRRSEVWGAAADRLRALLPQALSVLAEQLEAEETADRRAAAVALLRLAGPLTAEPAGPTAAADILLAEVEAERARTQTANEATVDRLSGRESLEETSRRVRARLDEMNNCPS